MTYADRKDFVKKVIKATPVGKTFTVTDMKKTCKEEGYFNRFQWVSIKSLDEDVKAVIESLVDSKELTSTLSANKRYNVYQVVEEKKEEKKVAKKASTNKTSVKATSKSAAKTTTKKEATKKTASKKEEVKKVEEKKVTKVEQDEKPKTEEAKKETKKKSSKPKEEVKSVPEVPSLKELDSLTNGDTPKTEVKEEVKKETPKKEVKKETSKKETLKKETKKEPAKKEVKKEEPKKEEVADNNPEEFTNSDGGVTQITKETDPATGKSVIRLSRKHLDNPVKRLSRRSKPADAPRERKPRSLDNGTTKRSSSMKKKVDENMKDLPDGRWAVDANTGEVIGNFDEMFGGQKQADAAISGDIQPQQPAPSIVSSVDNGEVPKYVSGFGDKESYLYYDIKLTSLSKSAEIISLAVMDCDGRFFYGECTPITYQLCEQETLLKTLPALTSPITGRDARENVFASGPINTLRGAFVSWYRENLSKHHGADRNYQFVSDNASYTFLHLLEFITGSSSHPSQMLPKNFSKAVYDINQEIASSSAKPIEEGQDPAEVYENYVPTMDMVNRSRFDMVKEFPQVQKFVNGLPTHDYDVNNALIDTLIIRLVHQSIWGVLGDN